MRVVEILASAGADLNALDTDGSNAMLWTIFEGHKEVALRMRELGADDTLVNRHDMSARIFLPL